MAPRKKRTIKSAKFTARTRSGVKYQPQIAGLKKTISKKSLDVKKTKEITYTTHTLKPAEAMLTRSHKKFGKFKCLAEKSDDSLISNTSKDDTDASGSGSSNETEPEYHPLEEVLLPESQIAMLNEDVTDIVISDDDSTSDVILVENDSESCSELTQDDLLDLIEDKVVSDHPKNTELTVVIMESTDTPNAEAILTEQLSNLDVNTNVVLDSDQSNVVNDNCAGEEIEYVPESEKESAIYHLDNFESEVIIDCIADDVIPISGEQEIVNEDASGSDSIQSEKELLENKMELNQKEEVKKSEEIETPTKQIDVELPKVDEQIEIPTLNTEFTVEKNEEEETIGNHEIEKNKDALTNIKNVELPDDPKDTSTVEHDQECETKEVQKPKSKSKVSKKKSEKVVKSIENTKLSDNSVRRSNRIKSISVLKQKSSKGHGLVKHKSQVKKGSKTDNSHINPVPLTDNKLDKQTSNISNVSPIASGDQKPVKVKSRWRRSSELELGNTLPVNSNKPIIQNVDKIESNTNTNETAQEKKIKSHEEVNRRLKQFVHLKENLYLTERISCKEAKKMVCDCFLTEEDIEQGEYGCGEDCLNRLLMIECGNLCAVAHRCTNKRFQKGQFAPCEVFQTEKKGLGIRAAANIPYGEFILEYVGEVLNPEEFEKRATEYSKDKNQHYYFMSLRADAVIDATRKGNVSRFINHSCDPNAETQKWTVNGELRIGFFSKRTILAGEEITFDYQFQRYGKEAQKCFCEAHTCRGWLGEEPEDEDEDEEDEYEEEEEEEEEEDEEEETEPIEGIERTDGLERSEGIERIEVMEGIEGTDSNKVEDIIAVEKPISTSISIEDPEPINSSQEHVNEPENPEGLKVEKVKKEKKRIVRQRLPRKDIFEDLDLDEEIETLQTTGLKNQAHTLKLSRLMVRAKEPAQRTKLLRVLRRGEFPCRRLFLDYHGLRLIHGWMTDAQHMSRTNKKLESLRLEILQTLATLPIPNKTMLQDSKVLPTVQKWSVKLEEEMCTLDSDSNSPKIDAENLSKDSFQSTIPKKYTNDVHQQSTGVNLDDKSKTISSANKFFEQEDMDISPIAFEEKESIIEARNDSTDQSNIFINDYETEIIALALKLLEEWSVLKEVFRIPKKERIEQMKEHEREADRKYRAGLGLDGQDSFLDRKNENRYELSSRRQKKKKRKNSHIDSMDMSFVDKYERRKLFALQVEQREMERRRNQREFWRQHEQRCVVMGTDPRFTAPFDPNQGYQCIWNPQTGQWQNYPLPGNPSFNNQNLPPPQPHHQSGQQFIGGSHISSTPSSQPINHSSASIIPPVQHQCQPGQPVMKHIQSPNLPHHTIHSKPSMSFNTQPPVQLQPPNPIQQQYNRPPTLNMNLNLLPNMNSVTTAYVATSNQHSHQQRNLQQSIPYPSPISEHVQQQPLPPTYHMPLEPQTPPAQNLMHSNMPAMPSSVHNKPPPLPALPYQENLKEQEDTLQVKFMGPIPPPAKLPPKWKCAKDKYGRPYYYHIRARKAQWEPPELPPEETEEVSESSSSSESSSGSSDSSSEETDSDDDIDDARLLLQLKNKFKNTDTVKKTEKTVVEEEEEEEEVELHETSICDADGTLEEPKEKSLDDRLIEEFCFLRGEASHSKKRRTGLVQEILISPRTEEDRLQFKEDMKRYKQNKEKLKRQKELLLEQSKKHVNVKSPKPVTPKTSKSTKKHKISVKTKLKEMTDSESAKKIKESFRSSMAVVMVSILNAYRKPDCKEGRITNTEDFKHLARKLTHFVMLKELKHCQNIEDLTCTESVKSKAKEFVRKYMSKFGETYQKPKDEADFY